MGTYFVVGVLAFFALITVVLSLVQYRRIAPNAFHCTRCGAQFRKPAHHDFPKHCPRCHATDWAAPLARS